MAKAAVIQLQNDNMRAARILANKPASNVGPNQAISDIRIDGDEQRWRCIYAALNQDPGGGNFPPGAVSSKIQVETKMMGNPPLAWTCFFHPPFGLKIDQASQGVGPCERRQAFFVETSAVGCADD